MINYRTYIKDKTKQLSDLLAERKNASTRDERAVQHFFEENPFTLLSVLDGIDSQYAIFGSTIISQPQFKSFDGDRSPDFLIVTWNSLNLFFNFIEIEDPSKKIFSAIKQKPSFDFLQAYNQIIEWSSFGKNEVVDYCEELLKSLFKGNFNNTPDKKKHCNYILLYGFSDEILRLGERHNHVLQEYFAEKDKYHCTFSRLLSNLRFEQPLFTVKKDATTNKFKSIGFTPFRKYNTDEWSDFHNIIGKQEIITNSDLMTKDEKKDLIIQIDELDKKSLKEIIELVKSDWGTSAFGDIDI